MSSIVETVTAPPRRATIPALASLAAITVLFGIAFYPAMVALVDAWSAQTQTYSYGFLVPPVAAWLIWIRRDELRRLPITHSFGWGTVVTGAGLVMLFAGRVSTVAVVEAFALIATLHGLTLLLLGPRMFRALAFPIWYLIAMIPIWDSLTAGVHPYFQDLSARIGVATLQLFGIPVIRQGFFIELPNITLEVAQECSGVNNLIAVLCVGIPMTQLFVRGWWKRSVVLAVAALVALLSNSARVAMVSVFAYYGIRAADGDVHGPYSVLRSLMVSGVGFVTLFWLISRFREDGGPIAPSVPVERRPRESNTRFGEHFGVVAVAIIMLSTANGLIAAHRVGDVPLRAAIGTFPNRLGQWQATGGSAANDLAALNFDDRLSRTYVAPDGSELNLFIGYYRKQGPGRELADSRMRGGLGVSAQAWTTAAGGAFVKDFLVHRRNETYHVTYWYMLGGSIVSEDYKAKVYTAWNSVAHRTSDGAIIMVSARVTDGEPIEVARSRVKDFVEALMSASKLYLPS